jgi:hypothetical protein
MQGLISKEKVRGHFEYFVNSDDVANELDWIEQRFRPGHGVYYNSRKDDELYSDDEKNVIKKVGKEDVKSIAGLHKGDRVKLLFSRGFGGVDECVLRFAKYAHLSIENDMKLEVLLSNEVADALIEQGGIPTPPRADMIRLNIVPSSYGTAYQDMFIFRDSVLLINTHKDGREHISQGTVVDLSKHMLNIACETGWSVDLVSWLNKD